MQVGIGDFESREKKMYVCTYTMHVHIPHATHTHTEQNGNRFVAHGWPLSTSMG